MTRDGRDSSMPSKSKRSMPVALREKTEKLAPPVTRVAPRGKLRPVAGVATGTGERTCSGYVIIGQFFWKHSGHHAAVKSNLRLTRIYPYRFRQFPAPDDARAGRRCAGADREHAAAGITITQARDVRAQFYIRHDFEDCWKGADELRPMASSHANRFSAVVRRAARLRTGAGRRVYAARRHTVAAGFWLRRDSV